MWPSYYIEYKPPVNVIRDAKCLLKTSIHRTVDFQISKSRMHRWFSNVYGNFTFHCIFHDYTFSKSDCYLINTICLVNN